MNSLSFHKNRYKIEISGSKQNYWMKTNFHFASLVGFSDTFQAEFDVQSLHNDDSDHSSRIAFRKVKGDARPLADVLEYIIDKTIPN